MYQEAAVMETLHREIIPARKGKAGRLERGQLVR